MPGRQGRQLVDNACPCVLPVNAAQRLSRATAKLSRSQEKAPRNPDLRPRPERETAGQAPVPYAREALTSVSMCGGGSVDSLAARTSASAKVLVGGLCIRSRPCAALLNVAASTLKSRGTRSHSQHHLDLRVNIATSSTSPSSKG